MKLLQNTLADLWHLLDRRSQLSALGLIGLLIVNGGLEMVSVLFLFGYIGSLSGMSGERTPISAIFEAIARHFDGVNYAAVAGLVLVAAMAIKNASGLLSNFALMRFAMKRYQQVASRLFEGYLNIRLDLSQKRGTLDGIKTIDQLLAVYRQSFIPALLALSDMAIMVTMVAVLFLVLDPILVIVPGIVIGLVGGLLLIATRRLILRLAEGSLRAETLLVRIRHDGLRGLIDVRLGGSQDYLIGEFSHHASQFAIAERRTRALENAPRALNEVVLAIGIVMAAIYFAEQPGGMAGGMAILAMMGFAGLRITASLSRFMGALQAMRSNELMRRLIMSTVREIAPTAGKGRKTPVPVSYLADEADDPLPELKLGRRLTAQAISYRYPDAASLALDNVSITIERGQMVGFCGPSGGGKSTLALALMGFLKPHSGRILCDDVDIFQHVRAWHKNIGYVSQSPFISPRSIRENIAFAVIPEEIDDDAVWQALEQASLADLVRRQPQGIYGQIGEEGMTMSGGQRQRLSIARALYRNPDFLVFDEATAALDSVTEREISRSIIGLRGHRTVLCIAHRLSTLKECNTIYLIENGRATTSGTFDHLSRCSPTFKAMLAEFNS